MACIQVCNPGGSPNGFLIKLEQTGPSLVSCIHTLRMISTAASVQSQYQCMQHAQSRLQMQHSLCVSRFMPSAFEHIKSRCSWRVMPNWMCTIDALTPATDVLVFKTNALCFALSSVAQGCTPCDASILQHGLQFFLWQSCHAIPRLHHA